MILNRDQPDRLRQPSLTHKPVRFAGVETDDLLFRVGPHEPMDPVNVRGGFGCGRRLLQHVQDAFTELERPGEEPLALPLLDAGEDRRNSAVAMFENQPPLAIQEPEGLIRTRNARNRPILAEDGGANVAAVSFRLPAETKLLSTEHLRGQPCLPPRRRRCRRGLVFRCEDAWVGVENAADTAASRKGIANSR